MLALRSNCECCEKDLAPEAPDAVICSFECTFCRECAERSLRSISPGVALRLAAATAITAALARLAVQHFAGSSPMLDAHL